mmetsp:Transcript_29542/g.71046  ORF Transcript_29542/g.71046 Transcript_29542/m.71046 type:complete len:660 (+) Transcript_29542:99-2078(+)
MQQAPANASMGVPNHINGIRVLNSNGEAMQPRQVIMAPFPPAMVKTASANVQSIPGWVSNHVIPGQPTTSYQYSTPGSDPQSQLSSISVSTNQAQVSFVSDAPQGQRKNSKKPKSDNIDSSQEAKAQHNRERNREHARSTRLRKKAYVQELKEMADGLREIQTTEIRQRRMSVQKMMDVKKSRRRQVQAVLAFHAECESDPNKWRAVVEESFWFKQPVTPFRSFRRSEVEKDCRIVRGIDAMICDAASLSVMVERIGFRSARWQQIKRRKLADKLTQASRVHINEVSRETESSLSSESSADGSNAGSWGDNGRRKRSSPSHEPNRWTNPQSESAKVISCSESSEAKKNISFGKETDSSEESKTTDAEASQYAGDYQAQKRQRTSEQGTADQESSLPLPGGVVHQVRANNDAVRFEGDRAIPLHNGSTQSYMPSPYGSLFSAEYDIGCYYAFNEDDMEVIDDCLMCPFIFRSKNAVLCGALADCVMPGMLRATFSAANKVQSIEIVFDAMGFMQQLDGANGGDVNAQVIPGSLEMALMNCGYEARVLTEARPPYSIVHVNEAWTKLTKYSQLEVEGKSLLPLIQGEETDPNAGIREGRPVHRLESVAQGRAACSTNVHYDKHGNSFIDFMSSYPLTNASDEISHILHISHELPKISPILS